MARKHAAHLAHIAECVLDENTVYRSLPLAMGRLTIRERDELATSIAILFVMLLPGLVTRYAGGSGPL